MTDNLDSSRETRVCRICGFEKDKERGFYKGQGNTCKECVKNKSVAWRKGNPTRYRATRESWEKGNKELATQRRISRLRRRYKISKNRVLEMLEQQNFACLICRVKLHSPFDDDPPPDTTKPVVDHDHRDGHVRGILCSACNVALGLLEDDPKIIRAAFYYLKNDQGLK